MVAPEAVERFRADLERLTGGPQGKLGVAVSGGPDSLALLLLAAAAYPGQVEAATVDHGLRPESAEEARFVQGICQRLQVHHVILEPGWPKYPSGNVQALAREARYAALEAWAEERGIEQLLTAHHIEDQAETVLMRLARGAGVRGLSGIYPSAMAGERGLFAYRPVLTWRRDELATIVATAGLDPVQDPSNIDERYDRTRARRLLAGEPWLAPPRLAAVASHMADAERALAWSARELWAERSVHHEDGSISLDAADLPKEYQWRLLLRALRAVRFDTSDTAPGLTGPKLERLLAALKDGRSGTLAGVRARPGPPWRFEKAPPRRKS